MHKTIRVVLILLFACGNSKAQSTPLTMTALNGQLGLAGRAADAPQVPGAGQGPFGGQEPAPFGSGEQPLLRFAGDNGPQNVLMFDLNDSTGYDDHVYGTNQNTYADFFTDVGARLSFFAVRKRLDVSLDYVPSFFIYRRNSSADYWNQTLGFDATLDLSRRFQLRVRDSGTEYSYGSFGLGQQLVPGLGPPGGAILYSINPETRTVSNASRLDLLFTKSERTVIDVFGADNTLTYRAHFSDWQGATGGLTYSYRVTRRGAFSATYVYTNTLFQGTPSATSLESTQGGSRFATQSLFLSYAYQISKTTSVSFYGGPERTHVGETLVLSLPLSTAGVIQVFIPFHRFEWDWSAGGGVTTTTHKTAISLTASRAVSNGGGLLTAVNSDFASLGFARRLPHSWQWSSSLNYGLSQALIFGSLPSGSFNTEIGQVSLGRKLGEHLSLSFDYQHQRQRQGGGYSLGFADLDRDRASVRFDWGVKKIPLGHHRL
jgi:hypothetical protein